MEFVKLTDEQRQFFDDNGYLVVPNMLSSEPVERLAQASDRLIESFARDSLYVQRCPSIVEKADFHLLLALSPTVKLVTQLLSPNIQLHTTVIIYKRPQSGDDPEVVGERGWHRDIAMAEDLGHNNLFRASIKVGYCLTDFHQPRSGFTILVPDYHLIPTPLLIPKEEVDPVGTVDLCLKSGDIFLFEIRIFHTSAPNLSPRTSKVILFRYSYRWMGGRKSNMEQVQPNKIALDQIDDIRQQLLGGDSNAVIHCAREHGIASDEPFQWAMTV